MSPKCYRSREAFGHESKTGGNQPMMVYLIDSRVPVAPQPSGVAGLLRNTTDIDEGWRRVVSALPGHEDCQVVLAQPEDEIPDLVDSLIQAVRTLRTIWLLRILAHGDAGWLELGTGMRVPQAGHFAPLANYMTAEGRGVEIHGCNVAGNQQGRRLIQRLANAVRMPVTASPDVQFADNRFTFDGTTVTAQPARR